MCVRVCPQIDEVTVDFNAKISSITTSENTSKSDTKIDSAVSGSPFGQSFSVKSSYSNQKTEKNTNSEQREFSMHVFVRASQAGMPAGMARILNVLEESIMQNSRSADGSPSE